MDLRRLRHERGLVVRSGQHDRAASAAHTPVRFRAPRAGRCRRARRFPLRTPGQHGDLRHSARPLRKGRGGERPGPWHAATPRGADRTGRVSARHGDGGERRVAAAAGSCHPAIRRSRHRGIDDTPGRFVFQDLDHSCPSRTGGVDGRSYAPCRRPPAGGAPGDAGLDRSGSGGPGLWPHEDGKPVGVNVGRRARRERHRRGHGSEARDRSLAPQPDLPEAGH